MITFCFRLRGLGLRCDQLKAAEKKGDLTIRGLKSLDRGTIGEKNHKRKIIMIHT